MHDTALTPELRAAIEAGPLTHLSTINRDGSPQVSVIWIGFDDGRLTSAHLALRLKLRNIQRDPRVVLSFLVGLDRGVARSPYAVLRAHATVEQSDRAWDLLNQYAKVYMGPDSTFPAPRGPGYITRYDIEKVGGAGPWAS